MKVYVKKGECNSILPMLLVSLLFFILPSLVMLSMLLSARSVLGFLDQAGLGFGICFLLFMFSIYFIFLLLKPAKYFQARLLDKTTEIYKNKEITLMTFIATITNSSPQAEYRCYTYGPNELEKNQEYLLKVKEATTRIKKVEPIGDKKIKNNHSNTSPIKLILSIYVYFNTVVFMLFSMLFPIYFIFYAFFIALFLVGLFYLIDTSVPDDKNLDNSNIHSKHAKKVVIHFTINLITILAISTILLLLVQNGIIY